MEKASKDRGRYRGKRPIGDRHSHYEFEKKIKYDKLNNKKIKLERESVCVCERETERNRWTRGMRD